MTNKEEEINRKVKKLSKRREWQLFFDIIDNDDKVLFQKMKNCKNEDSFMELKGMAKQNDYFRNKMSSILEEELE